MSALLPLGGMRAGPFDSAQGRLFGRSVGFVWDVYPPLILTGALRR
jgi:hypothetical protein